MKRVLSLCMVAILIISAFSVYADTTSSDNTKTALIEVKKKLDIPDELCEFSSSSREYGDNMIYNFSWNDKDNSKRIYVSCDSKGRIISYSYYDPDLYNDAVFTDISTEEIFKFADDSVRRLVPEAFADENDTLSACTDDVKYVGNLTYTVDYNRYRDGIPVKRDNAFVIVKIADEEMYIENINVSFDYDTEFEVLTTEIQDYESKYTETFPMELVYRNKSDYKYIASEKNDVKEAVLLYRIKDNSPGYISAATGEEVKEEYKLYIPGASGGSDTNDKSESSSDDVFLSKEELKELDNIEGLKSKEEVKSILKSLPYVDYKDSLQLNSFNIYSNKDKDYFIDASYSNSEDSKDDSRYINIRIDAGSGELFSLSNSGDYYDFRENMVSESQKQNADSDVSKFILTANPTYSPEFKEVDTSWTYNNIYKNYVRLVNGIEYINNTMSISFDAYKSRIESYYMNYTKNVLFESPEGVIGVDEAYKSMLGISPLEKIYVLSGGKYKLCYALKDFNIELNPFNGERSNKPLKDDDTSYQYSDVDFHWSKEAVEKLASVGIGFDGDKFNPDEEISQYDLLRLFVSGMKNDYYIDSSIEELYEYMYDFDILTEIDKNPDASVTRENAFIYMIRISGLEKIAMASEIFKIEYSDGNLMTDGNIGYAAILSGLGVICGNGGYIRPEDNITRAEAATMLYKYMLKVK